MSLFAQATVNLYIIVGVVITSTFPFVCMCNVTLLVRCCQPLLCIWIKLLAYVVYFLHTCFKQRSEIVGAAFCNSMLACSAHGHDVLWRRNESTTTRLTQPLYALPKRTSNSVNIAYQTTAGRVYAGRQSIVCQLSATASLFTVHSCHSAAQHGVLRPSAEALHHSGSIVSSNTT